MSGNTDQDLEARLEHDEARLAADEARLVADEARLAADEEEAHTTWVLSLTGAAIAGVSLVAIAALVIAVLALRRDLHAVEVSAPPGSVSTASLQDASVTAEKLAAGSVWASSLQAGAVRQRAIAPGAVGSAQLAPAAVRGGDVARDALTGRNIREATLGRVPFAARSAGARVADDARSLGGAGAGAYVAHAKVVRESSELSGQAIKGPLSARCTAGARVISGGAAVEGGVRGVAIVASAPQGHGWTALARRAGHRSNPWRLVVTAICVTGGA
jgi:hypothetical protein